MTKKATEGQAEGESPVAASSGRRFNPWPPAPPSYPEPAATTHWYCREHAAFYPGVYKNPAGPDDTCFECGAALPEDERLALLDRERAQRNQGKPPKSQAAATQGDRTFKGRSPTSHKKY